MGLLFSSDSLHTNDNAVPISSQLLCHKWLSLNDNSIASQLAIVAIARYIATYVASYSYTGSYVAIAIGS